MTTLYPETEPYDHGLLDVGDGHRVYWETCGNPDGKPAVVLHGGPGSGCTPGWRRFFDPSAYRVVLLDQRGCGRSTPHASEPNADLSTNTTHHLLADLERLRNHLGIDRWLVFGGSWGSTLGLAYAERYPERVSEVIVFSVATATRREVEWLTRDAGRFFPAAWARFRAGVPHAERDGSLVDAYSRLLHDPDPAVRERAARDWCDWEDAHVAVKAGHGPSPRYSDPRFRLAFARLVTHYWRHAAWLEDGILVRQVRRLSGIPAVLVHGRLDVSSPLDVAWHLSQDWFGARLVLVDDAGHGFGDLGMREALVEATNSFSRRTGEGASLPNVEPGRITADSSRTGRYCLDDVKRTCCGRLRCWLDRSVLMPSSVPPCRRRTPVALLLVLTLSLSLSVVVAGVPAEAVAQGLPEPALPHGLAALPPGFSEEIVISGLSQPTAVALAGDGRVFVAEKRGVVLVFDSLDDPVPGVFADLRTHVHNHVSRGLTGLALHPDFPEDPGVYVLYAHDAAIGGVAPLHGTPGEDVDPCGDPWQGRCVGSGRLSRLVADGDQATSEEVLVEDWCQQHANHTLGDLEFGADGALYASGSDGAVYGRVDVGQTVNPCDDPPGEGGALRSQSLRSDRGAASLAGTIIRVDPHTGEALPDNPLAGPTEDPAVGGTDEDANARRIVAYGFRNAFRFAFRPGTSDLWVGDVGMSAWEEVNRTAGDDAVVDNFGWPCYEGAARQPSYDGANLPLCEPLYATPGAVEWPVYTYPHDRPVPELRGCDTLGGTSVTAVEFYPGGAFPSSYDGALFLGDHARNCLWYLPAGADGLPDPSAARPFHHAAAPVDLAVTPDGDLLYVDLNGGTVRRVTYTDPTAPAAPSPGE